MLRFLRAIPFALLFVLVVLPTLASAQGVTRFIGSVKADAMSADIIIPVSVLGSVANAKFLEFEAPWDLQVEEVSTRAAGVTNPADGVVTVNLLDDGASILSAPLEYMTASTTVKQTGMSTRVAKGSTLRVTWALTGTGPALSDVIVTVTGRRAIQ